MKHLRNILLFSMMFSYLSCATSHTIARTPEEINRTSFNAKKHYQIKLNNGESVKFKGSQLAQTGQVIIVYDKHHVATNSIPTDMVATISEEKGLGVIGWVVCGAIIGVLVGGLMLMGLASAQS